MLDEVVQMENSNSKDSVKTEGKETKEVKTFAQIEKEAREKVLKDYDKLYERLGKLRRDDRFSDYINSITEVFDPHSSYFNQNDKNDFDVSFSGKVEGISCNLMENLLKLLKSLWADLHGSKKILKRMM